MLRWGRLGAVGVVLEHGAAPLSASVSPLYPKAWALPLIPPANVMWVILSLRFVLEERLPWKQRLRLQRREHPPPFVRSREGCLLGAPLPGFGEECCLRSVLVEGQARPSSSPSSLPFTPSVCETLDGRAEVTGQDGGSGAQGTKASGPNPVFRQVPRPSLHPQPWHFHQLTALL